MSTGEFSVYQFFDTGDSERVREGVDAEEAVKSAAHYSHEAWRTLRRYGAGVVTVLA